MQTRNEYLKEAELELGEKEFSFMYAGIDNEYYALVEKHVKQGQAISKKVYDSLAEGQRFHFNKHYNHRDDKVYE